MNNGFTNSNPATATIASQALALTPNPLTLTHSPATLTIAISNPAGANGQVVSLSSVDTNIATVSPSITIPQGATSATVSVVPGLASGSTAITAQAPGFASATATVNVTISTLAITLNSGTLGLSRTMNGTITLGAPAPAGGVIVTLASTPDGVAAVEPLQVAIAAGSTTGTFTVTGSATGSATISGSAPGYGSGSGNVNVVIFGSLGLPSNVSVGLGESTPFAVTLPVAAPAGGVTVTLTSSDTARATITPSSVFISAGAKAPSSQPRVNGINLGSANITATAESFNSATQGVKVTASVSFSPSNLTINGATTQNLTLTLSAPAPVGGLTLNLSSSNPAVATVGQTVTFASNATSVVVPVKGLVQGSTVLSASALPSIADATANVTVASGILLPSAVAVAPGQSVNFPLTLAKRRLPPMAYLSLSPAAIRR